MIECSSTLNELSHNVEIVLVTLLAHDITILGDLLIPIPVLEKGKAMCLLLTLDPGP